MPGNAPPVATEREAISSYLRQQHDGIRFAAYGLTDEQAHQVSSRSAISIANLVKHVTHTERTWMERAGLPARPGPRTHGRLISRRLGATARPDEVRGRRRNTAPTGTPTARRSRT